MQYVLKVLRLAATNEPRGTSAVVEYFEWRHELQRSAPAEYRRSQSPVSWNAELHALSTSLAAKAGPFSSCQLFGSREEGVEKLFYFEMLHERSRSFGVYVTPRGKSIPIILFARNFGAIVRSKKSCDAIKSGERELRTTLIDKGDGFGVLAALSVMQEGAHGFPSLPRMDGFGHIAVTLLKSYFMRIAYTSQDSGLSF